MKEIKSAINYQEANLTFFKDTLHQLSAQLKEHKNKTADNLAQLQTSITATLNAMKSSLDTKLEALNASLSNNLTQQLKDLTSRVKQLPVHTCGGGGWRRVVYLDNL